jgi:hypothetical protein
MTAFGRAWALLKDSASKEEYRAMPIDEFGFMDRKHIGAQDFDLGIAPQGEHGIAQLGTTGTYSRSKVYPPSVFRGKRFKNANMDDGETMDNFISRLGEVSAHESAHQAIHTIMPELMREGVSGHEYGATASEYAQRPYNPEKNMRDLMSHPKIANKKGIRDILRNLLDDEGEGYSHPETMSFRARDNARRRME